MHRSAPIGGGVVFGAVMLLVLVTGGCTMCPSPFDYAGPVPNGSAPQNDFRARSNGILPLGAQPKAWPPVVEAAPTTSQEPTLAAPQAVVVTAADDATWLVATEADADMPGTSDDFTDPAPANDQPSDDAPVAAAAAVDVVEPPLDPLPALEPAPRPAPPAPVLRETEGWRPKR